MLDISGMINESEKSKIYVPKKEGYKRMLVFARNQDDLQDELSEEIESGLSKVVLEDDEDEESTDNNNIIIDDLNDEDLERAAEIKESMREKQEGKLIDLRDQKEKMRKASEEFKNVDPEEDSEFLIEKDEIAADEESEDLEEEFFLDDEDELDIIENEDLEDEEEFDLY